MKRNNFSAIAALIFAFSVAAGARHVVPLLGKPLVDAASGQAPAQDTKPPYPRMAPLEQYLTADRTEEINLARSAAPPSISADADVLVLGRHGYETATRGKNGFVCLVERSWTAPLDNPDFWNPKLRGPMCLNAPAARSYLPVTILKTNLVLNGKSKDQMAESVKAAREKKELPAFEPGAMCFMMAKEQYLGDQGAHWHPHVMFFVPTTEAAAWGANMPGSPVITIDDPPAGLTIFLIPVWKWSDGTPGPLAMSHTVK
jgi:hypothetical protein